MPDEKTASNFYDKLVELIIEDPFELTPEIREKIKREVKNLSKLNRLMGKAMVKTMPIPREVRENPKFVYALSIA